MKPKVIYDEDMNPYIYFLIDDEEVLISLEKEWYEKIKRKM